MFQLIRRIRYLLQRNRFDKELANDLDFHREMAAREGRSFNRTLRIREESRDAWGWTFLDRLSQDLRYTVRLLRKSPGFTIAAILMLAVGIGVNVAAFGFFDLLVLRPLNVRDPATLLRFHRRALEQYAFALPYPEMAFFRDHSRTLSSVLALNTTRVAAEGEEARILAHFVTPNFFRELGAQVRLGSPIDEARDAAPGAQPVVVLSDGFWRRHFAADPLVIGKTIRLNGKPAMIAGVARPEFNGLSLDSPDVWAPLPQHPYFVPGSQLLTDLSVESSGVQMWGRLQPGSTPAAAEQELAALAKQLRGQYPSFIWKNEMLPSEAGAYGPSLRIGNRRGTGSEGRDELNPLLALAAALGLLILAVACANLGGLLLARSVARQREISIRTAVGASSKRLIRQLFTESLVLAFLGSAAGVALGYAVLRGLLAISGAPSWMDASPDARVALFAAALGVLSALLFGLTPALQAVRRRRGTSKLRHALVAAQVAASCILLIVASLLVRALNQALTGQTGFEYQQVVSIDPQLAAHGYSDVKARAYLDALESRLRGVPGVVSVALTDTPPFGNHQSVAGMEVSGRQLAIHLNNVDASFFETLKLPIVKGRALTRSDAQGVVVSQSIARLLWPDKDPIGEKFSVGGDHVVVGIAGSARLVALQDSDAVEAYFLTKDADLPGMNLLVRTAGAPQELARAAVSIARGIDPDIIPEVHLLRSSFVRTLQGTEKAVLVITLLGFVAHLLACLGIVGVVAYAVSQRVKEIGIRMALGARPWQVLHAILRQFALPVTTGLVAGVAAAMALSQVMRRVLYGVSHLDPLAYLAAIGLFLFTVALAALVPARRALRIDPARTLRCD